MALDIEDCRNMCLGAAFGWDNVYSFASMGIGVGGALFGFSGAWTGTKGAFE